MNVGQKIPQISLPAVDGSQFDTTSLLGKKYLLTFFRFATCPFCNMRMAELIQLKKEFGDNFEIVAIFQSEMEHLKKHSNKHLASFPILADPEKQYYEMFDVHNSLSGMFKGMIMRMPTVIKGMSRGYIPLEISSRLLIMPLSLLVDEQGIIQSVYQGKDEGDHLPLDRVVTFAKK